MIMNKKILFLFLLLTSSLNKIQATEEFDTPNSNIQLIPSKIFSHKLWEDFSVEHITDKKLRETMRAIFQYRENAKFFILEAEAIRKKIPDKMMRDAISGAIAGAVVGISGGITSAMIASAATALANITTGLVQEYFEIVDLFDQARLESEKADILEKYVLANACIN